MAPNLGIISASHDATLKLWTLNGACLTTYTGHCEIIYSCAFSENRHIASGTSTDQYIT